jgi:glycosyltransferase involved in cell wall biosynthesis
LLSDCAAVTVVSPSWGADLDERFAVGSKLHVVTNGYDPEELSDVTPCRFDHFAIVYTGCFYPPKRTATPLMSALRKLKSMDRTPTPEWRFHYYGIDGSHVREVAAQFGVEDKVVLHGDVPRREALAAVGGAQVAAVVASVEGESSLAERGIVTGKIFEALGLKTPVLVVAPPGSDVEDIAETAGLSRCFEGSDVAGMAGFLGESMLGHTPPPVTPEVYGWPSIGKKLDQLLRDVAVGRAYGVRSAEFQVRGVRSA